LTGAPVLDEHASAGASADSFDHVDVRDDHLVAGVEDGLLLRGHGVVPLLTDDHAWFTSIIGYTLGVGGHVLNLLEGELNDTDGMGSVGKGVHKGSSLFLVSEGIKANGNMFGMKTHEAVGVIDYVTSLILGFEGHSLVWEGLTVDGELVEPLNKLVDHLDVRSVRSGAVEGSVSVIEHDGALTFKGLTFFFEVGEVDSILVTFLESGDDLWGSLVSS